MPLPHRERHHTLPGTPPDRSRAVLTRNIHKIAFANSLATARTDAITPIKTNPCLISNQDGQKSAPSSQGPSTNGTPYFTPPSSFSPLSPGATLPDVGPSFRPQFGSILNGVAAPPVPGTAQGHQSGPVVISSSMPAAEIIQHLINSGCSNVTEKLDLGRCGEHPIRGGGFGDIYQGVLIGGAKVAIKCPRLFLQNDEPGGKILKDIAQEIYVWSKLRHPNILELIGLSTFHGQISIVSLWMENGTLTEYISKNQEADRFQLCTQVSAGLAYLHGSEVIRVLYYVKANVFISGSGVAKLADFGNTVLKSTIKFTENTGGLRISVRWAAPELLNDGGKYTKEADIYALGMANILCESMHIRDSFPALNLGGHKEAVAGKMPFGDNSESVVLGIVLQGRTLERPRELDLMEETKAEKLWEIMSQCWTHTVANRPSASQVKHMLEGVEKCQVREAHAHESIASTTASTPDP
ncbi:hypothetical protein FRC06_004354 [Ceratobasidium sp. 370]|nr:hypothetical protein FRC06_004354 [Ceratobasidium sp. 370]